MTDVVGGLFGGDAGSTTSTTTKTRTLPDWLKDDAYKIRDEARSLYSKEYTPYTGQRLADLTTDQQNAYSTIRDLQTRYNGDLSAANDVYKAGIASSQGPLSADTVKSYMNPYIQNVLDVNQRKLEENFASTASSLRNKAMAAGAFGGDRAAVQDQQLYKNFLQQASDNQTQGMSSAYESAYSKAMNDRDYRGQMATTMANLAMSRGAEDRTNAAALEGAGQAQQDQTQKGLDINYEDWQNKQKYPYEQLQFYNSMVGPYVTSFAGENGTTTQTTDSGSGSMFGNILGAGLGLAGLAGGLGGLGTLYGAATKSGIGTALHLAGGNIANSVRSAVGSPQMYGPGFAKGGLVRKFADGGTVDDAMLNRGSGIADLIRQNDLQNRQSLAALDDGMPQSGGGGGDSGGLGDFMQMAQMAASIVGLSSGGPVRRFAEGGLAYDDPKMQWLRAVGDYNTSSERTSRIYNDLTNLSNKAALSPQQEANPSTVSALDFVKHAHQSDIDLAKSALDTSQPLYKAMQGFNPAKNIPDPVLKVLGKLDPNKDGVAPNPPVTASSTASTPKQDVQGRSNPAPVKQQRKQVQANSMASMAQNNPIAAAGVQSVEQTEQDTGVNMPLLKMGMALLSTKGNFGKQLGAGFGAYADEKKAEEQAAWEHNYKEAELANETAKANAYSLAQTAEAMLRNSKATGTGSGTSSSIPSMFGMKPNQYLAAVAKEKARLTESDPKWMQVPDAELTKQAIANLGSAFGVQSGSAAGSPDGLIKKQGAQAILDQLNAGKLNKAEANAKLKEYGYQL